MKENNQQPCDFSTTPTQPCCGGPSLEMLPIYQPSDEDEPCCGPPAGPPSSPAERPGYVLCPFVEGFVTTAAGPVPQVKTTLDGRDRMGTLWVRLGLGRNDYNVAPGLYAVGTPDADAPVLVTANYKLTFDHLRKELDGLAAWILVLDTRGINVWCAAGKGTFDTEEIVRQVQRTQLDQVVQHRKLVVPQLGATGVAGRQVKKRTGFEVVWGPIQARDIKSFLEAGQKADPTMRRVTFTFLERLVLVPVELSLLRKYLLWTLLATFVLSGIGSGIFSLSAAWQRGLLAVSACIAGIVAGCVVVPALLPWIPGRAFAFKGALMGLILGMAVVAFLWASPLVSVWPAVAMLLLTMAASSFLAMNFTGSTPFTSPSGVEKEMRRAIPLQLIAIVLAAGLWVGTAFVG